MRKNFLEFSFWTFYHKLGKRLTGQAFVFFMNAVSKKGVKYRFNKPLFNITERESSNTVHYFIKPRAVMYRYGLKRRVSAVAKSYLLDQIYFDNDDLVVDVGANCGDLIPYFTNQRYVGFEPSPAEFKALQQNSKSNCKIYNFAVSDKEIEADFYISSAGADSSLHKPPVVEKIIRVKQIRLDKFINEKIKLLKVDAEGAEVEVINGAENLLSKIEFIAIDLGFEKGIEQETTAPPVFNFLYQNDFMLYAVGKQERYLFQNSKISSNKNH
jgi:FkbM family methyltransferase